MRIINITIIFAISALSLCATGVVGACPQSQWPTVKRAIPAVYPVIAAHAKESGTVVIEVKISPDGAVTEANVVEGHKLFRGVAQKSARNWVFNSITDPTLYRTARLTFSFRLIPKTVDPEALMPVFLPPYGVEIRGTTPDYVLLPSIDPPNRAMPKRRTKRGRVQAQLQINGTAETQSGMRYACLTQRWLSQEELNQFEDVHGFTLAITMRLSNQSKNRVYFLGGSTGSILPEGYRGFRKMGETKWQYLPKSRGREGAPGSEFTGVAYRWLELPSGASIEFETHDWSSDGEEHIFSAFVRKDMSSMPVEITSDIFRPLVKGTASDTAPPSRQEKVQPQKNGTVKPGTSERIQIGPDVSADLILYFKRSVTEGQISTFWHKVLSTKRPDGKGYDHRPGVGMIGRESAVQGHEAISVSFFRNATQTQRDAFEREVESSPIVYKVLKNIAPIEVKRLD